MARTTNGKHTLTPEAAVDRLEAIYAGACAALSRSLDRYLVTRKPPTAKDRAAFRYPLLRVVCREVGAAARTRRAYAKFQRPGVYATTVTHPGHFRRYLLEQLEPLVAEYGAEISVDVSSQEIPYPYVLERVEDIGRSGVTASELASHFPTPRSPSSATRWRTGSWRCPRASRARSPCSMRCGSTTPCAGWCTTPVATGATCSSGSCSPTITATSTSSCAGAWRASARVAGPTSAWCCRAAPRSDAEMCLPRPRRRLPPASGTASRCRPIT